ncbi:MAG: sigma-70 family RNA polymerase sigma factor [Geminocystis sp.]|nr:sigma-70 family RNA polymerase sigma factor [Geminocystis sp.]
MQPRNDLMDLFSTFIQFSGDRFGGWLTDFRLRRNIEKILQQEESRSINEKFLALHFYRQWLHCPNSLARNHLLAYLQEPCYLTALNVFRKFPHLPYTLSDYFQICIANYEEILRYYKPAQGTSLVGFARVGFRTILNNSLRQKAAADICTDWALLRKTSKKRLIASLKEAGLDSLTIQQYCLLFSCFQRIYTPNDKKTSQKLTSPPPDVWEKIIAAYQQQLKNYPQLSENTTQLEPEKCAKILKYCALLIRQYLYPKTVSLNAAINQEESRELLETIASEKSSPLQQIIDAEETAIRGRIYIDIQQILTESLRKLPSELSRILELYYRDNLTQKHIEQQTGIKQYNVSRKLAKAREILLKNLMAWVKDNLSIDTNIDDIKYLDTILEGWLIKHYNS